MSDQISVERLRETWRVRGDLSCAWMDNGRPCDNCASCFARHARTLDAEVERLNDLVTGVPQLERTIARLTAERDAASGLLSVARSLAEENANERDECESALHRLAKRAGVPDDGPDEIVNAVLETVARLKAVAGSGAREMDRETIEVLVRQRNEAEARTAELERALRPFVEAWRNVPARERTSYMERVLDLFPRAALAAPEPVTLAQARQVALDAIDESDAAWSAEAEREAAPEPEEPRCGACQYNDDGECTRWCDACYFSNGGVPTDARKRPEEPRCPTCGGKGYVHEMMPMGGYDAPDCPDCQPEGEGSETE